MTTRGIVHLLAAPCVLALVCAGCAGDHEARPSAVSAADAAGQPGGGPSAGDAGAQPGSTIAHHVVSGVVASGGEATPAGLTDAPRSFAYLVQTDDGGSVTVTYTAYPPSSAAGPKYTLSFYAGAVQIGDYLVATGTYDSSTRTLVVAQEGDSIRTYPQKP